MWQSLPKNVHSRVDRGSLRYAAHRFFMQTYQLSIIGLEDKVNSQHEEALLLTQLAPAYVRDQLEGKGSQAGFSLDDAVVMIATLERLVENTAHQQLEKTYLATDRKTTQRLREKSAKHLMVSYMLRWMLGDDSEGLDELDADHSSIKDHHDNWESVEGFVHGEMKALQFARRTQSQSLPPNSWNEFRPRYSFTDLEAVAKKVTMSFGNFWTTECQRVKSLLVAMDHKQTGRVKLSDFYGAALGGEWRFSESKDYLRQLGALDESSSWQGPRVVITNYLTGASNCIVFTPHYRVCCTNECEGILGEVEAAVSAPLASPEAILSALAQHSSPLDDNVVKLSSSMKSQLQAIAKASPGGMVPVHGRLFMQWLHYAFPRECPFPHKAGDTFALAPTEAGDFAASEEQMANEVAAEAAGAPTAVRASAEDEDDHMSQWSHEEELLSESVHLHAPWEATVSGSTVFLLLILAGAMAAYKSAGNKCQGDILPTSSKVHCF
jgi:hypothetical protein